MVPNLEKKFHLFRDCSFPNPTPRFVVVIGRSSLGVDAIISTLAGEHS